MELLKSSAKNVHPRELNDASQVGIEQFNEIGKYGREHQRDRSLE